jgi:hypothetical protein
MQRSALLVAVGLSVLGCGGGDEADTANGTGGSGGSSTGGSSGSGATGGSGGLGGTSGSGAVGGSTGGSTCASTLPETTFVDFGTASEVTIANDPGAPAGIFDFSVEYPAGAPGGALTYSAVQSTSSISTRIAVSDDAGATWTWVGDVNQSEDTSVPVAASSQKGCPGNVCAGRLIHEVSSVIFDADDPDSSKRWKVFTHSYLVGTGDALFRDLGYIGLYTSSDPLVPFTFAGKVLGWNGESTLSSSGALTNVSSIQQLADCILVTEPGALWRPGGVIDLAVGCATLQPNFPIRIELLRSFDHGNTFQYAGRLLEAADSYCLGGTRDQVNAADLFFAGGKSWLLATPAGPIPNFPEAAYRGCFVFPLAAGGTAIERDANGAPVVERVLDSSDGRFTGACSVSEGASALGYVVHELASSGPPFRALASATAAP